MRSDLFSGPPAFGLIRYRPRPHLLDLTLPVPPCGRFIALSDVIYLMRGDVLMLPDGEVVEVVAAPDLADHTIEVRRGIGTSIRPGPAPDGPGKVRIIANNYRGEASLPLFDGGPTDGVVST